MFELLILARFKPTASHQIGQITTNGLDPCLEIRQHPNLFDLNTVLTSLTIELCGCHKGCHNDSPKVHKIVFNFMLKVNASSGVKQSLEYTFHVYELKRPKTEWVCLTINPIFFLRQIFHMLFSQFSLFLLPSIISSSKWHHWVSQIPCPYSNLNIGDQCTSWLAIDVYSIQSLHGFFMMHPITEEKCECAMYLVNINHNMGW